MQISNIEFELIRKDIKNLHLSVLPPDGAVRVSVPSTMSDRAIKAAVIPRLSWIRKQQQEFLHQIRQSEREMVSGESHYLWGKRYRLEVIETTGKHFVKTGRGRRIQLHVYPNTSPSRREHLLNEWYRDQLRQKLPFLLEKWAKELGVSVESWGTKKMKTKWGSSNVNAKRIWFNLELAKKPVECLEYIIVHELVHFKERHHNARFRSYMNKYLPNWEVYREQLNVLPLKNELWK